MTYAEAGNVYLQWVGISRFRLKLGKIAHIRLIPGVKNFSAHAFVRNLNGLEPSKSPPTRGYNPIIDRRLMCAASGDGVFIT